MPSKQLAAAALVAAAAAPAPLALGAAAKKPKAPTPTPIKSRHLWATVDACNTAKLPDAIGVRGSMPGTGVKGEEMYMRFQVQYRDGSTWKLIPAADTGYLAVGKATYKARQSGHDFTIMAAATPYVLRGLVSFQWRKGKHVVFRAMLMTSAGHVATAGADPRGYSAAACELPAAPGNGSGGSP